MNPLSISTLATGFSVLGAVIGLPSVAVLLLRLVNRVRPSAESTSGPNFGKNPDALLLLLKGISETVGAIGRVSGFLGQILLNALSLVATVGVILAFTFWFTGRGLHAHAQWARLSGFIVLGLALLSSLLLALSLPLMPRVLMLAVAILCVFGLHTLWAGYSTLAP